MIISTLNSKHKKSAKPVDISFTRYTMQITFFEFFTQNLKRLSNINQRLKKIDKKLLTHDPIIYLF